MRHSILICALAAATLGLGTALPVSAQILDLRVDGRAETRQQDGHHARGHHYHPHYYERGYDRERFAYYAPACEQRSGGLGLGLDLGGSLSLQASLGQAWTECDKQQFGYAHDSAWRDGRVSYWENPRTGRRGAIRPGRHYRSGGRDCLSGEAETFNEDGDYQRFAFQSCRDGSGQWQFERRSSR